MTAALFLLAGVAGSGVAQAAPDGRAGFTRCAACHLPTGAGVPGSFPPLGDQIAGFARTRPGRAYLVSVVTRGLSGPISVHGSAFNNFMPAQSLDDADAAAVLTHVVNGVAAARPPVKPFTADEIAAIRRSQQAAGARESRDLRPETVPRGRQ